MISVKSEIYEGLSSGLSSINVSVYDYYPDEIERFPLVVYLEEDNKPYEIVDGEEVTSEIRYRVDVWAKDSTTDIAIAINRVFAKFGIRRTMCSDAPDVSGLKHKIMRFEGIVDKATKLVYSNINN